MTPNPGRQAPPLAGVVLGDSATFKVAARQSIRAEYLNRAVYVFEGVRIPSVPRQYELSVGMDVAVDFAVEGSEKTLASYILAPFNLNVKRRVPSRFKSLYGHKCLRRL